VFSIASLSLLSASSQLRAAEPIFQLKLDSGHPWRPPFGLDRVGLAQAEFQADAVGWSIPNRCRFPSDTDFRPDDTAAANLAQPCRL
jgi:hypothetical protein